MKSSFLSFAAIALICALAGCAAPAKTGAAKYLPDSPVSYSVTDFRELVKTVNTMADRLHLNILRANIPAEQKKEWDLFLAAFRLAALQCGLNEDISGGTSCARLPGDRTEFRTVRVLATDSAAPGLLWQLPVPQKINVRQTLDQLPADTMFAAGMMLDTELIAARYLETMQNLGQKKLARPDARHLARSVSGCWTLIIRPGKTGFYWELQIPDHANALKDRVKKMYPDMQGDTQRFPPLAGLPPCTVQLLPGKVKLAVGEALPLSAGSLLQETAVAERLPYLPENGAGILFLSPRMGTGFRERPEALQIFPCILGVLTVRQDALILDSVSDWDAASESWILPKLLFGMPLTVDSLSICKMLWDAAAVRQESADCTDHLQKLQKALNTYAAGQDGKFPAGSDVEGLRELLKAGLIRPEMLVCPAATGDTAAKDAATFHADNCSYVYIGGSTTRTAPDYPLIFDWPLNHKDQLHVLTVSGRIRTFPAKRIDSCRKFASFLQSRYRYSEPDFKRLLETADKLDNLFLKGKNK